MPTVHKRALKETDSHLELGLKISCHSPAPACQVGCVQKPEQCTPSFPGSGSKLGVTAVLCWAGSELPTGSCAEVGSELPGKHHSRNSPPGGIAPAALPGITPILSARTIAHNPSSTQEYPWAKGTAAGGSRSNTSPAQCLLLNPQHRQHAGALEYIFHFSHFWSVLSTSLGFWGRCCQSFWERQHAAFSACYCHCEIIALTRQAMG